MSSERSACVASATSTTRGHGERGAEQQQRAQAPRRAGCRARAGEAVQQAVDPWRAHRTARSPVRRPLTTAPRPAAGRRAGSSRSERELGDRPGRRATAASAAEHRGARAPKRNATSGADQRRARRSRATSSQPAPSSQREAGERRRDRRGLDLGRRHPAVAARGRRAHVACPARRDADDDDLAAHRGRVERALLDVGEAQRADRARAGPGSRSTPMPDARRARCAVLQPGGRDREASRARRSGTACRRMHAVGVRARDRVRRPWRALYS